MFIEGNYTSDDEMAAQDEVRDFLYGLVRLVKPKVVLETGCYKGGTSLILARALAKNGFGKLITCDTDEKMAALTAKRLEFVKATCMVCHDSGVNVAANVPDVDLAFLDSSGDRVAEILSLHLSPGAIIVLHDSARDSYNTFHQLEWLRRVDFKIPRGLALFFA